MLKIVITQMVILNELHDSEAADPGFDYRLRANESLPNKYARLLPTKFSS